MPKRVPKVLIEEMLEAVTNSLDFVEGQTWDSFCASKLITSAVIRQLEVLGEAAKLVPDEIKEKSSELPWRAMTGLRNRLIHEYFDVSLSTVWNVLENQLPKLKPQLENLLDGLEQILPFLKQVLASSSQ